MDIENAKEELSEESKKIAEELEGKSADEIKAMEDEAELKLQAQLRHDASEYIYNLLKLDTVPFTDEGFEKIANNIFDEHTKEVPEGYYKNVDQNTFNLHQDIINLGYSLGGTKFVSTIIDEDPESAKALLETAIQLYIELRNTIEIRAHQIVADTLKGLVKDKEEK